jgi:hypothetical protein
MKPVPSPCKTITAKMLNKGMPGRLMKDDKGKLKGIKKN